MPKRSQTPLSGVPPLSFLYYRVFSSGGLVLDLDENDDFLGLEIIDALQNTTLDTDELNRIGDAEIKFERNEEFICVEIVITVDSVKNFISSQYPASAPA